DVQLGDAHLAVELLGDLLESWRDLPAGTAPFGPEIHDHGSRGLEHLGLEIVVRHFFSRHLLLLIAGSPTQTTGLASSDPTLGMHSEAVKAWCGAPGCASLRHQAKLMGSP